MESTVCSNAKRVLCSQSQKPRKWSKATCAYAPFLFKHINKIGWGESRSNGDPIHANDKAHILSKMRGEWHGFYQQFTKTTLERHGKELRPGITYFYHFTGARGTANNAMFIVDIDCKHGETGADSLVEALEQLIGKLLFSQPSRGGVGRHVPLIIDKQGRSDREVNKLYDRVGSWINNFAKAMGYRVSGIEIKGKIQHPIYKDGQLVDFYCGTFGRIPLFNDHNVNSLLDIPILTYNQLDTLIATNIQKPPTETPEEQNILNRHTGAGNASQGGQKIGLQKSKTCKDDLLERLAQRPDTGRRYPALLRLFNNLMRKPTVQEAMDFLFDNNLYTPPWDMNIKKRIRDVTKLIDKIERVWNPAKATLDYSPLAKGLLEGHDLTYGSKGEKRQVTWQDLTLYLDVMHQSIIIDPNDDGSVPYARIESLWNVLNKKRRYNRPFRWDKAKAVREFLIALNILEMVDEFWSKKKAMRWTIGSAHPMYGKVDRILRYTMDPALRAALDDPYILEKICA